jgi:hypothetical protein
VLIHVAGGLDAWPRYPGVYATETSYQLRSNPTLAAALTQARQRLIAFGSPIGLLLAAHGDIDITLTTQNRGGGVTLGEMHEGRRSSIEHGLHCRALST